MTVSFSYEQLPAEFMRQFQPNVLALLRGRLRPNGRPLRQELVRLEQEPFEDVARHPLDGTDYEYQLAVSAGNPSRVAAYLREYNPEIVRSRDSRSGLLVLHGDKVIGSYMYGALSSTGNLAVHQDYRRTGLATRMVEQVLREVRWRTTLNGRLTPEAAAAALHAHRRVVAWAIASGKDVPQAVIDHMKDPSGDESLIKRFSGGPLMQRLASRKAALRVTG
jgi:GNAT superfamily N-acetyltransferase